MMRHNSQNSIFSIKLMRMNNTANHYCFISTEITKTKKNQIVSDKIKKKNY